MCCCWNGLAAGASQFVEEKTFRESDLFSLCFMCADCDASQALAWSSEDCTVNVSIVSFIYSFIIIVNWTLLQICVAVLLERFVITHRRCEKERVAKQIKAMLPSWQFQQSDPAPPGSVPGGAGEGVRGSHWKTPSRRPVEEAQEPVCGSLYFFLAPPPPFYFFSFSLSGYLSPSFEEVHEPVWDKSFPQTWSINGRLWLRFRSTEGMKGIAFMNHR